MRAAGGALREQLETLVSDRPEEIRSQVVEALRAAVPCHLGLFHSISTAGGKRHYANLVVCGDTEAARWLSQFVGAPVLDAPWLPPNGDPSEHDRFLRIRSTYDDRYLNAFEAQRRIFQPLEVGDQLRAVLCDGLQLIGWIGLLRRGANARFTRLEERTLSQVVGEVKTALSAADLLDEKLLGDDLFALYRPDGSREHISESFHAWTDSDREARLCAMVRDFDAGLAPAGVDLFGAMQIQLVRLDGAMGVRYLVTVARAAALRFEPDAWLTTRQREVAGFIIAGATCREVSEMLGIAPETVKAHLKAVYQKLGVANRLELTKMLRGEEDC